MIILDCVGSVTGSLIWKIIIINWERISVFLDKWLSGYGKVEKLDGTKGAYGLCYYGIFKL